MVKDSKSLKVVGKVIEKMPNAMFKIKLKNDREIVATVSGKMRKNYIRILPGDEVTLEVGPYDISKGRIVYREKKSSP